MDTESAFWLLHEIEDECIASMLAEWESNKGNPAARQSWRLISSSMLIKEWNYNYKTGLVHEKIIEKIQDICIENYCKIYINSILFGHTPDNPFNYLEPWIDEDWNEQDLEEWLEDYEWFACDDRGNWRISDYGLDKIGNYAFSLLAEDDYCKKLFWIDCILNVAHQRSDLSSWFVEGGSKTLCQLAEREEEIIRS